MAAALITAFAPFAKGCARKRSVSDKAALNGIQCVAGGEFGCKRHIVGDARCITAGDPCQWCK
ncbi:hypothetical protein CTTA_4656 [Comamonas testosteroni]|uniref:Uncharacterized protein n=1 Tax=Comamonas testosteroni TaxID=285 RepID=A0A5A7ML44_COMTE|nr:hypothetical protein CTTA_4656 [Comamonas testosteroni]